MSILREQGTAYLAMRRSLGYKLRGHDYLLMEFIGYLEDHGHSTVTTDAAMSWATAPAGATRTYWNRRLSAARCFARYLSAFDRACQIPPAGLIWPSEARPAPYRYSPEDISALIHAAGTLASPLQAATCQALISLLAVTGGRVRRSPWMRARLTWTLPWSPSAANTTGHDWSRCTPPRSPCCAGTGDAAGNCARPRPRPASSSHRPGPA
jgi:hypothetical protein